MEKTACVTRELATGSVDVYAFEGARLHAYRTGVLDNEVFVIERDGRGLVIEYPCFFDSIRALEGYLAEEGIVVEGIVASYHMAGASFAGHAGVCDEGSRRVRSRGRRQGAHR